MIRTSLINGVINLDSDFSKYIESLSNPGVVEGFNIQDGVVKPGKARVKAERTNGETIYCYVENTEDVSLSGNDGKVYIVIDQEDIDSGLVSEDGLNIARIEEGEVRPEKNFLKLGSIDSGDVTDERYFLTNVSELGSAVNNYGPATSGTDSYAVSIQGVTEYKVGNVYRFMADVDNEGNATLNVNGLGAVEIRKNHDKILDNGDIEAGQIVEVAYDGTYFQMDSQVATVFDITSAGNTQYKNGVAGEDLTTGVACYMVDYSKDNIPLVEVGRFFSSADFEVIGTGMESDTIKLRIGREGSTSGENLVIELIDGENILGSITVNRSDLSADIEEKTLSFSDSITTVKGKIYTLRLRTYNNGISENYYIVNKRKKIDFLKDVSISGWRPDTISSYSVTAGTGEYKNSTLTYHIGNSADVVWGSTGNFKVEVGSYYLQRSSNTLTNNFSDSSSVSGDKQFRIKIFMNSIYFYYKASTDTSWIQFGTTRTATMTDFTCKIGGGFTINNLFINEVSNTEGLNFITNLLQEKNILKLTNIDNYDTPILVATTTVDKGDDIILESGGESSLFKDGEGILYIQSDGTITGTTTDYAIGEYNKYGDFKYYDGMVKKGYYSESLTFSRSGSSQGSDGGEIILKGDCYVSINVSSSDSGQYMDVLTYFNNTLLFHGGNVIFLGKKGDKIGCFGHKQTTGSYVSYSCTITALYNL